MTELPKSGEIWTIAGSMVRVAHVIDDRVTCTQIVDAGQPCESWTYGVGEFMARFRRSTTAEAHSDPTPRARGQNTCRAALMTVIGLHRRENTLGPDMARAIVDATQALMDLDGLRAGEAADLDVAKERDDARALAEGLTRGQDDLRRQLAAMEAERDATAAERDRVVEANAALRKLHHGALAGLEEMTGRRDLAMQDRDAARERMSKAEAEAVILQERLAAFRRGMDADITLDAGHSAPGNPTADAVTAPIGRRLADARLAVFATTATAAPAAGMTQGRLKNLEAGVLLPDPDDLQRLARAYGQPEISGWSVPVRDLELVAAVVKLHHDRAVELGAKAPGSPATATPLLAAAVYATEADDLATGLTLRQAWERVITRGAEELRRDIARGKTDQIHWFTLANLAGERRRPHLLAAADLDRRDDGPGRSARRAWAQEQPGVVSGMTWEAAREVIGKALAERESWPRLQHALTQAEIEAARLRAEAASLVDAAADAMATRDEHLERIGRAAERLTRYPVGGSHGDAARAIAGAVAILQEPGARWLQEMAATSEERRQHLAALRMLGWQGQPVEEWAQEQVSGRETRASAPIDKSGVVIAKRDGAVTIDRGQP